MSSLLDLFGFAALTFGVYELAGRGWALIAAAGCLFLLGLAVDGIHPVRSLRAAVKGRYEAYRLARATKRARRATT